MSQTIRKLQNKVKVISFDITGTLLSHKFPIMQTYAECAIWSKLPNPPNQIELKEGFKKAYYKHCIESPAFGYAENMADREWWRWCVKSALAFCGRTEYSDDQFERYFRRVYQHYGSSNAYQLLPDALPTLEYLHQHRDRYTLGILTNSPQRSVETILPAMGIHDQFHWFVSCRDVGAEKPSPAIYDAAFQQALFWIPDLKREEILHIGDSFAADYCGARAAGFQALYLDRSSNPLVSVYQDWLQAPDYPGKCEQDIREGTITSLTSLIHLLESNWIIPVVTFWLDAGSLFIFNHPLHCTVLSCITRSYMYVLYLYVCSYLICNNNIQIW